MIRLAVRADIPALVRMARDFHAASPMRDHPFSVERAAASACAAIDMPGHVALVLDSDGIHGAILGSVRLYPLGDVVTAHEDVFWIDPSHRGRWGMKMIRAFEDWAKEQGASVIGMSCPVGTAEPIYRRAGFALIETTFVKGL